MFTFHQTKVHRMVQIIHRFFSLFCFFFEIVLFLYDVFLPAFCMRIANECFLFQSLMGLVHILVIFMLYIFSVNIKVFAIRSMLQHLVKRKYFIIFTVGLWSWAQFGIKGQHILKGTPYSFITDIYFHKHCGYRISYFLLGLLNCVKISMEFL